MRSWPSMNSGTELSLASMVVDTEAALGEGRPVLELMVGNLIASLLVGAAANNARPKGCGGAPSGHPLSPVCANRRTRGGPAKRASADAGALAGVSGRTVERARGIMTALVALARGVSTNFTFSTTGTALVWVLIALAGFEVLVFTQPPRTRVRKPRAQSRSDHRTRDSG